MEYQYQIPFDASHVADPNDGRADFDTPFSDYMGAVVSDTWNNGTALGTFQRREEAQSTFSNVDELFGGDTESVSLDLDEVRWETPMQKDEQEAWIKQHGMEGKIKPFFVQGTNGTQDAGYTRETLNMLKEFAVEDEQNAFLRQNASDWFAPAGVAAMIGTSLFDIPGMLMTMGAPVLGQTRALNMLRMAESSAGRWGVRALEGAVSGAGAMAILEPTIVANRSMWHDEWSPYESVLNIGMGAILGAGLHSAFGALGERIRNKRGQRQPWQILTPDAESERLRMEFRDGIMETINKAADDFKQVKGVGLNLPKNFSKNTVNVLSGQFDVIARTIAYDLNKPLAEIYSSFKPTFEIVNTAAEGIGKLGFTRAVELAGKELGGIKPEVLINELGQSAIKLFMNTKGEDIERAFFYGYRKLMEYVAKSPESRQSAKTAYSQMERFVNAVEGKEWTPAQDKRFADAAMLFLRDKKAVPDDMAEAFERMNQFMREMKLQAENTGVAVPRALDDRLDTLQSTVEERDASFSQRMIDLLMDRDEEQSRQARENLNEILGNRKVETQRQVLNNELVSAEDKFAERSDLVSEEIRENLRASGIDEETIDMLVDKQAEEQAVIAQEKATAYKRLIDDTSEEEAMAALECEIRKFLGM